MAHSDNNLFGLATFHHADDQRDGPRERRRTPSSGPAPGARSRARRILVLVIAFVVLGAGSVFWVMTGRLSADASVEQINDVLDTSEHTALTAIEESAANIERVTDSIVHIAELEQFSDLESEWAMFQALQFVPELSGVYIADQDGRFNYVFRTEAGYGTKHISPEADGQQDRTVLVSERDSDFATTTAHQDHDDVYDPRVRPWFEAATATPGEAIWTAPYTFFTSQRPGITRALASGDPEHQWVVGVDIELVSLVHLLDSMSAQISGEVFLFDQRDTALTRSGLIDLAESDLTTDARVAGAIGAIVSEGDVIARHSKYELDGVAHTARYSAIEIGETEWLLVSDLSDRDIPIAVAGFVRALRLLALGIGGLAVAAAMLLIIPATKPISRLEQYANTDSLTGLPNRRTILQRGETLRSSDADFGVAMIDVDHFKRVNDSYGHQVGDEALEALAVRLVATGCEVGRLGGEEFLVLLDKNDLDADVRFAESLRAAVADSPIETSAGPISLTVSIGVAHQAGETFSDLVGRADTSLLEAKLHGRNRVLAAKPRIDQANPARTSV